MRLLHLCCWAYRHETTADTHLLGFVALELYGGELVLLIQNNAPYYPHFFRLVEKRGKCIVFVHLNHMFVIV